MFSMDSKYFNVVHTFLSAIPIIAAGSFRSSKRRTIVQKIDKCSFGGIISSIDLLLKIFDSFAFFI